MPAQPHCSFGSAKGSLFSLAGTPGQQCHTELSAVLGPGGLSLESTWHKLLVLSGLTLPDSPNKQRSTAFSGHTDDPAAQLECGPLSSRSLARFLWWQVLIFLMTKRLFTRSGRLGIVIPCFRVKTATLITPSSRMF